MRQIASMPEVEHSWLAPLITESNDLDELEHQLSEWMLERMYPHKEATDLNQEEYQVWRIVRTMLPALMENEAITAFLDQNPNWMGYLPEVNSAREAAYLGAEEIMYVDPEVQSKAMDWLNSLAYAEKAERESLLQAVTRPSQPANNDSQN